MEEAMVVWQKGKVEGGMGALEGTGLVLITCKEIQKTVNLAIRLIRNKNGRFYLTYPAGKCEIKRRSPWANR